VTSQRLENVWKVLDQNQFHNLFPIKKNVPRLGVRSQVLRFSGARFMFSLHCMLKTNISGHNAIWGGTKFFTPNVPTGRPKLASAVLSCRFSPLLCFKPSHQTSTVITFSGFCAESRDSVLCNFTSWLADVQREYRIICLWCKDFAEKKREQTLCVQGQ